MASSLVGPSIFLTLFSLVLQLAGVYLSLINGNSVLPAEESAAAATDSSTGYLSTFGLFSQQVVYRAYSPSSSNSNSSAAGGATSRGVLVVNVGLTSTCKTFIPTSASSTGQDDSMTSTGASDSVAMTSAHLTECSTDVFDWSDARCRGDQKSPSVTTTFQRTETNLLYGAQALLVASITIHVIMVFSFCGAPRGYGFRCFLSLLNFLAMGGVVGLLYYLSYSWATGSTCPVSRGVCGVPTTCWATHISLGYWFLSGSAGFSLFLGIFFLTTLPCTPSSDLASTQSTPSQSQHEPFNTAEEEEEEDGEEVSPTTVLDMEEMRIMLQEHRRDLIGEFRRRNKVEPISDDRRGLKSNRIEASSSGGVKFSPPPVYDVPVPVIRDIDVVPEDRSCSQLPSTTVPFAQTMPPPLVVEEVKAVVPSLSAGSCSATNDHFDAELRLTSPTQEDTMEKETHW